MKTTLVAGMVAVVMLSACQTITDTPRVYFYDCGGETVRTEFQRQRLRLALGDKLYTLQSVPAASGAQYATVESPAPRLTFWDKSGEARLQRGDSSPVLCQRLAPPGLPLTARGQEPGWLLALDKDQLNLRYQYGEKLFHSPTPEPQTFLSGYRYRAQNPEGETLVLVLAPQYCTDAMSGMPYPYTAKLTMESQTFDGCAGDPRQLLVGREWLVESINGEGVDENAQPALEFTDDGKLFGHAGCNRYSGRYQLTGEGLTVGPLISTKMACAGALMEQESRMLEVLQGVKRFEIDRMGALWLRGQHGKWLKAHP